MIEFVRARYDEPAHATALVELLDHYARDPAGSGTPLSDFARGNLVASLAARPFIFSVLAFNGDTPVGLVNAIEGFSTFACAPLVNVHDVVVIDRHRGRGNAAARALYEKLGFDDYRLDPALGEARFMQKWLD